MIKAAITPGTHPQRVRIKTITIEPHPLSITARGGSKIAKSTRIQPILILLINQCTKFRKNNEPKK